MPGRAAVDAHAVQAKNAVSCAQLLRVGDQLGRQAAVVGRRHEIVRPVGDLALERLGVRRARVKVPVDGS